MLLLFLAAVSEYDQVLAEQRNQNRLRESVTLFGTIAQYRWFKDTDIVLFLNKTDLLQEKLASGQTKVTDFFDDYTGPEEFEPVMEFFTGLFQEQNKSSSAGDHSQRKLSIFPTCAVDTENFQRIHTAIKEQILEKIFQNIGLN